MRVDAKRICRAILAAGATETSLDGHIREACQTLYGAEHEEVMRVMSGLVADRAIGSRCSRLEAVRNLAQSSSRKTTLWLLIAILVGLSPALVLFLRGLRGLPTLFGELERQAAELEDACRERPGDRAAALRLAEAYARMAVYVRFLNRSAGLASATARAQGLPLDSLEAELKAVRRAERRSIPVQRGESMTRRLLAMPELSAEEEAALHVLLGHFLLSEGRLEEAEAAAQHAADFGHHDPRPHLLMALVCAAQRDYRRAVAEEQAALSKLAGWPEADRSPLEAVLWDVSPVFFKPPRGGNWKRNAADALTWHLGQDIKRLRDAASVPPN